MNVRQYNITIKCVLAILLSALFASCKDEDEASGNRRNPNSKVISFSSYTAGVTRAADVTSDVLKGKVAGREGGFQVSAWYDGALYLNDQALFENGLTIDNTNKITDAFDTESDTYYWPSFSAGNISFRAFNIESGVAWINDQCKSIRFPIKEKAFEQKDLVVAYAEANSMPENGVQPLNFVHALSKVNFSFVGADDNYKYTINRVEVIAAGEKVSHQDPELTFRETSTSLQNSEEKFSWDFTAISECTETNPLVKKNASAAANQGVIYTYYDGADIVAGTTDATMNETLMLIPQKGKVVIRVYYKVEDDYGELIGNCGYSKTDTEGNHDATDGIYGCKTLIVDLEDQISNGWEAGKSYRFVITLPTDNFLGDADGDGVADDLDDDNNDLDGDGDKSEAEFGMDNNQYIEFSVKVYGWDEDNRNVNIEILD